MLFEFKDNGNNNIVLPIEPLLSKLNGATETEIKVLIYAAAAAQDGVFDEKAVQELSGMDLTEILIALQYWRGSEVITISEGEAKAKADNNKKASKPDALQKDDVPTYSGDEISKLFEGNTEIKMLIDECQRIAGKMFNPHEINKIVGLYDYLGLSSEYILTVYQYCKDKNKTTVHYVEKTAFNMYNEGVDSDEKLLEYIKQKELFDSFAGKIRRIFGIGKRALTKHEESLITKWKDVYRFPMDVIEYAYEITIRSAKEASLSYTGKILDNWFKQGVTDLQQAMEASDSFKRKKQNKDTKQNASASSFDNDEFFEAALKRSYDNIGKNSSSDDGGNN
jgi:DnaD/phage-associated family protein